jgi:acetyltransferase-like isoleucine patch superfamily enzyme
MNVKKQILAAIASVVKGLARLSATVYSYSMANKFGAYKTKLYTVWISSEFQEIGNQSLIGYPIVLRGGRRISIGKNTAVGARGVLTAWESYQCNSFKPEIIIGNNIWIGEDCHISACNKIEIGDDVLMGKKVTITDNSHGKIDAESIGVAPQQRSLYSKGPVIIEHGVWIGDKATILSGVRIGENSIVGANALVTKDIPKNCVYGGVPAKLIRKLD